MKPERKKKLLLAAIPIAAVTVGCLAAQEDVKKDVSQRTWTFDHAPLQLEVADFRVQWAQFDAYVAAEIRAEIDDGDSFDDIIVSSILQEHVGVVFAQDEHGSTDACRIQIPVGAEALEGQPVHVRLYDARTPGELGVLMQVESEEACEEAGFYFETNGEGAPDTLSMCPSSCDVVASAQEIGSAMLVELVIDEA